MSKRNASCAIVGAGDYIGAAIARKFAAEGYANRLSRITPAERRQSGKPCEPQTRGCIALKSPLRSSPKPNAECALDELLSDRVIDAMCAFAPI